MCQIYLHFLFVFIFPPPSTVFTMIEISLNAKIDNVESKKNRRSKKTGRSCCLTFSLGEKWQHGLLEGIFTVSTYLCLSNEA